MTDKPMLFADFLPGQELARVSDRITPEQIAEWAELYPWDVPVQGFVPTGLATVLLMRSYHKAIPHRPPGNIHAGQRMQAHSSIRAGESVTTTVTCLSAERKGERRKLELTMHGRGEDGRSVYNGLATLFWAA
jgi:acyl dehydratase